MRTKRPLNGLLLYFWYSTGGKLILLFSQVIAWGIAFLVFGDRDFGAWIHLIFGINALMGVTLIILTSMGSKEIDWERFQLSMPIRRRDLASSQYLSVGLTPLIGIPIFVLFTGISSILHDGIYFTFLSTFITIAPFLSMPYIMGGLVFPLYSIQAVEKIHDGLFPVLMLISVVVPQLVVMGANRLDWSMVVASSLMLVVSLLIFLVSYFITRKQYAKSDF